MPCSSSSVAADGRDSQAVAEKPRTGVHDYRPAHERCPLAGADHPLLVDMRSTKRHAGPAVLYTAMTREAADRGDTPMSLSARHL